MINGVIRAHRRADCALVGAIALAAFSAASAREFCLYTHELHLRAALPDSILVTDSPVGLARSEQAAQSECLAEVMYYEARGEGIEGEKAVAEVVFQRTRDPNYPSTVCAVAYDGVQPDRRDCQFSFACDGTLRKPKDRYAWQRVRLLAEKIVTGAVKLSGTTRHAIAYHNVDVAPTWADSMLKTEQIGNHVFYRRDPSLQARLAQADMSVPQLSLSNMFLPPPVITVEVIVPSEKIQPHIQTAGAVGDGT